MINKKKAFLCFIFSLSSLSAHDFWVDSNNEAKLKATLGYGHDFPAPEKIAENRLNIFEVSFYSTLECLLLVVLCGFF